MVLGEEIVDDLAGLLASSLIQLLKEEDESSNYEEDL